MDDALRGVPTDYSTKIWFDLHAGHYRYRPIRACLVDGNLRETFGVSRDVEIPPEGLIIDYNDLSDAFASAEKPRQDE